MAINWSNVTDFGDLPSQANNATNGTFWPGMLYMVFVILFLILIGYGFEVAILVSSFIAMILALLLVYSGLVAWTHVLAFVGIILFVFLYIIWSGRKQQG
jgi:hypothetical protein